MIVVYEICAMVRGLIVQLSSGNSRALRDIMDVYQKRLYKYALQYVKNEFVAEEIVEDVFVALWNKHTELKDVEDISGFFVGNNPKFVFELFAERTFGNDRFGFFDRRTNLSAC